LESTNKITKEDISNSSFVRFSIWDFPGQVNDCSHPPFYMLSKHEADINKLSMPWRVRRLGDYFLSVQR
jgi:hypothetical protein